MRILVYPASLDLGGSQLNAIEISGRLAQRGHEVAIFGPDGPLRATVEALGLAFTPAPRFKLHPSSAIIRALNSTVRDQATEVVHGYEWPPILEAIYGPYLRFGTPVVGTVMSMGVAPFIPRHLPLIVGTAQIAAAEALRRSDVELLEPPVDTDLNQPWDDTRDARAQLGVGPDDFLVVVVSRLAAELKREGILEAVRASTELAAELPLRLVIVGDGPAAGEITAAAAAVNAEVGRKVVTLAGAWDDPRPAYAAADVCFGMGSSALRAMAFGQPMVVQGERGYWRLLEEESLPEFLFQGWYGIGDATDGAPRFAAIIRGLYQDAAARARAGAFSLKVVKERFSLDRAADLQEEIYERAIASNPSRGSAVSGLIAPFGRVSIYNVKRQIARRRGTVAVDDFNAIPAQPVAASATR
jgi:glycosyltransferase involved in cell wall biosynthesis